MRRMSRNALSAYTSVKKQTGVLGSDPPTLVVMLFEGAIEALQQCETHIENRDIQARTQAINKASRIIVGLRGTLNFEQGGEVAKSLDQLYGYSLRRLIQAGATNDAEIVREVRDIMKGLLDAWKQSVVPWSESASPSSTPS